MPSVRKMIAICSKTLPTLVLSLISVTADRAMIQCTFNVAKLPVHLSALLGMGRGSKEMEEGSEILDKKAVH